MCNTLARHEHLIDSYEECVEEVLASQFLDSGLKAGVEAVAEAPVDSLADYQPAGLVARCTLPHTRAEKVLLANIVRLEELNVFDMTKNCWGMLALHNVLGIARPPAALLLLD